MEEGATEDMIALTCVTWYLTGVGAGLLFCRICRTVFTLEDSLMMLLCGLIGPFMFFPVLVALGSDTVLWRWKRKNGHD